jgi:hypothetical protein
LAWDETTLLAWPHHVSGGRHDPNYWRIDLAAISGLSCVGAIDLCYPCLGRANQTRSPAGRRSPMRSEGVASTRYGPAPLMRLRSLQRLWAVLRCPRQPALGRSRYGITSRGPDRRSFAGISDLLWPLRFSAWQDGKLDVWVSCNHCQPLQVMRRRYLEFGGVPLPAFGFHGLAGYGTTAPACPKPATLLGFFAALRSVDPAVGWCAPFGVTKPTCRFA